MNIYIYMTICIQYISLIHTHFLFNSYMVQYDFRFIEIYVLYIVPFLSGLTMAGNVVGFLLNDEGHPLNTISALIDIIHYRDSNVIRPRYSLLQFVRVSSRRHNLPGIPISF